MTQKESVAMNSKNALFETMPVPAALTRMAIPTIISQLITLVYNIADTWFIGRAGSPHMVAASSLVLTVFLMVGALANLFGVGGGTLMVRLLGSQNPEEARRVSSWALTAAAGSAVAFSLLCLVFMDPLLRLLGASDRTIGYARQYLLFVVVIGGTANVLGTTMSFLLRNAGFSREAGFGLTMGGILNIGLDPLFMFLLLPDGYQVMGAGIATMLSNVCSCTVCWPDPLFTPSLMTHAPWSWAPSFCGPDALPRLSCFSASTWSISCRPWAGADLPSGSASSGSWR